MSTHQTVRRWVMTGAVTAVTVAGTIYGAQLKGSQDASKEKQRLLEATPEDRITQLEVTRSELMTQKLAMERKIELFHERCAARERDREEERLRQQRLQRLRENLK